MERRRGGGVTASFGARMRPRLRGRALGLIAGVFLVAPAASAGAQGPGMGPSPVGYTEAREIPVKEQLELTGSVGSRRASLVASEVAGLVTELVAREGDEVGRGEPLVRLRRKNLELSLAAAKAQLKEAQARLDLARRSLTRSQELSASGVISQQALDDAESEAAAWQGRVESLEAEIARVEDDLDRSVVRAPFAGVVAREHAQVGEWLDVGGEVAELVSLDDLEVTLDVPERYYGKLAANAPARVTFAALPDAGVEGKIGAVVPRADQQARTFWVKIRIPNPGHRIGVGMLARVAFPLGTSYPATVVPKDAVVRQGPMQVVYRINGEDQVEPVPIETGTAVGAWIEVRGPIQSGEKVVTRGNERLMPGMKVAGQAVEYPLP